MELTLPFPPSLNSYYGHSSNSRVYVRKRGELYRAAVQRSVREQAGRFQFRQPVSVFITFNNPAKVHEPWDMDNYKKAMFDALTHAGLWFDDSLVHADCSYKGVQGGRGNVEIIVEVL